MFVITSNPKAVGGPPQPFVIQLADGSTALKGVGEVVEQHLIPTGPEGKCGMWLRLVDLTPASREVHRQLLERREKLKSPPPPAPAAIKLAPVTPPPPKPRSHTIRVPAVVPPVSVAPRLPAIVPEATPPPGPAPSRPPTREELIERAKKLAGPSPHNEERVPPSPIQLPANPLATMDDEQLGNFVDCMIYEHSELYDVNDFAEPTDVQAVVYDPTSGLPPSSLSPPPSLAPALADPVAVMPSVEPVALHPPPFYVPPAQSSRKTIAIVAVASVVLGIVGGWILFANGSSTKAESTTAPAHAPAAAAMPPPAPAPAPPPAAVTPPPTSPSPSPSPSTIPTTTTTAPTTTSTSTSQNGCSATIRTTPAGVHVQYGALDLGMSPVDGAAVPCGDAPLVLTHPRYDRVARTMTASNEAPATLDIHMQRPSGMLTLRSIPPGAAFTINGAATHAPTTKVMAWETLRVTATLKGYAPWKGTIKVRGATGSLFARMVRAH
ncbi:MAG TPA: hypothetical protein VL463_14225 [Kofleriaceae bacterium]|nr:hypothetical protein [Kofleriaceae bacterium]